MIAIDLKETLVALIDSQIPVFVWGSPGVGKSSLVSQIAQEKEMKFIDLRLSLLDPTDLRGIPFFNADEKKQFGQNLSFYQMRKVKSLEYYF